MKEVKERWLQAQVQEARGWSDTDPKPYQIARKLNQADGLAGRQAIYRYITVGHALEARKRRTSDWSAFLRAVSISVTRDYRARLLARHDALVFGSDHSTLQDALEVCQKAEDQARAELAVSSDGQKEKKFGRPRKSDTEKWRTKLNRLLESAPKGVVVKQTSGGAIIRW